MADHPLRPATDRRLGKLLSHQLANQTSAAPVARGLAIPRFHPQVSCGISWSFDQLSPTTGHVPMHYSPVRHSPAGASSPAAVRLACVRHAASVQSEPGSNSWVQSLLLLLCLSFLKRRAQNYRLVILRSSRFCIIPFVFSSTWFFMSWSSSKPDAHAYRFVIQFLKIVTASQRQDEYLTLSILKMQIFFYLFFHLTQNR